MISSYYVNLQQAIIGKTESLEVLFANAIPDIADLNIGINFYRYLFNFYYYFIHFFFIVYVVYQHQQVALMWVRIVVKVYSLIAMLEYAILVSTGIVSLTFE